MPRKMTKAAADFRDIVNSKDPAAANGLLQDLNYYPKTLTNNNMPVPEQDYLIDATQYKAGEDPAKVPLKDKVFLTYWKTSFGSYHVEQKTGDELLATRQPEEPAFQVGPEPKLTGLSWLRHKLSWLFGEPDVIRQYNRRKEAANAKKTEMLNAKYGCDLPYNRELTDEKKAERYVTTGSTLQPVSEGDKITVSSQPKKENDLGAKNREKLNADLAAEGVEKLFGESATLYYANPEVVNALKTALLEKPSDPQDQEEQKDLVNYILALQSHPDLFQKTIQRLEKLEEKFVDEKQTHMDAKHLYTEAHFAGTKGTIFFDGYLAHIDRKNRELYANSSSTIGNSGYTNTKKDISHSQLNFN